MENYILGIDQSTQGTKALLFDDKGNLISRTDLPHRQIIDERGWVEHDPEEILKNTIHVVKDLVKKNGISKEQIRGIGISNQRETTVAWNRLTGEPYGQAIVWQCARSAELCDRVAQEVADVAKVEKDAKVEGRNMTMMLVPLREKDKEKK